MTREEANELLPIIRAFAEGKTIQVRINNDSSWTDLLDTKLEISNLYEYRIKPEQKYRPFKNQEECWQEMQKHQPFGWIKSNGNDLYSIASINCKGITTFAYYRFLESLEMFTFTDVTPFGIKEE